MPSAAPVTVLELSPRRGLSREEAARYVGVGTTKFDQMIESGEMPKPIAIGGRRIWDIRALDAAFDALAAPTEGPRGW